MGLLSACGTSKQPASLPAVAPDVYLVGFQAPTNYYVATYWKNGAAVKLPDNGTGSNAYSIVVLNNDVYVAGLMRYGNYSVATLWRNGTPTALGGLTTNSVAASVAVSGSDVYVAGYESISAPSGFVYLAPTIWKNGVITILDSSENGGAASSVYVSGGNVYVAGSENKTTETAPNTHYTAPVATYWKNGVATSLTDGSNLAVATSIFVIGDDVYVGGQNCSIQMPDCSEAVYWKNGSLVKLGGAPATVTSIFVSGTDVYASENFGATSGLVIPSYWKDGVQHVLAPASSAAASQIAVATGDVYVAGTSAGVQATYWKNGVPFPVGGSPYPSVAYGITLVTH